MGFFRRNQPQPETPEKAPRLVVEAQDDVGPKSASSPRSPGECTTQTEIDLPVEVGLDEYEEVVHNDDDKKVVAEDQPKAHRLKVTSILLVVLLIVVVATALAITLSMQDNNNDIVTSVNARDTEEGQYLLNILNATADETTLLDSSTPQGQAFDQLWRLEYETHTHATPLRVIQRYGLLVLYHSTNPAGWENASGWSGAEECNYFGVDCSEVESGEMAVSTLNLESNNLQGTLPTELCVLSNLENLNLALNQLQGSLPDCFNSLTKLQTLELNNNELSGELPAGVVLPLTQLATLNLANNQFQGFLYGFLIFITPESNKLLSSVHMENNQLTGIVPQVFGLMPSLTELVLTDNKFEGEILFCKPYSNYTRFEVDCFEVACTCCTNC